MAGGGEGRHRRGSARGSCVALREHGDCFLCLALAAGGFAKYVLPAVEEQAAAFGPALSVASIIVIFAAYALANRFTVLR